MIVANKQGFYRLVLVACMLFFCMLSCTARKHGQQSAAETPDLGLVTSVRTYDQNPFANAGKPAQVSQVLGTTWVHTIDADLLWALTQCSCAPTVSSKYLQRLSTTYGALPQTLVPDIREKILNDPKLKTINNLPGGIGDIADLFIGLYVTDGKIAEQIQTGVNEMVQQSIPGSVPLSQNIRYRFDLFSNLQLPQQIKIPESPKAFSVGDQATIWGHIFSQSNLWEGKDPMAFADHGFQFFLTLKTLAEWKYILGLDSSRATNRVYGGLTYDAVAGVKRSALTPYDPRQQPAPSPRFISGQYTVEYPNVKALDMALKVEESWRPSQTEASLTEQVLLLHAAAKAFSRMRPRNQNAANSIYDYNGGVVPKDGYLLPVAFLPGTAKALETFFINQNKLEIYQIGDRPSEVDSDRLKANISTISKLMAAMKLWVKETQDLSDLQENAAVQKQLADGHKTMLKVLRLAVQTMLAEFIREDNTERTPMGIMMVRSNSSMERPRLSEASEALSLLAEIEQTLLPSQLLRQRVMQLFHWLAATYFRDLAQGNIANLTASDIIWTRQALQRFAFYPEASQTVWFKDVYTTLTQQIASWDGSVP